MQENNMIRRIGVIGAGEIARIHMEAISPLGWQVAGCYDVSKEAAGSFREAFGGRIYESAQALLEDETIDTVYLCTRHDSHVALGCAAIAAGKNVFLEKPMAMTASDAGRLLAAYQANPVPFVLGYNMRMAPATQRFCRLMKEHGVQAYTFKASMTGPPFMDGWASDPVQGGGVLVCQGSHMFDLLGYVLGGKVAEVCAATQYLGLGEEREPNAATVLVRLENGVCGTVLLHDRGTASFHAGTEGRMVSLTVYAPQGTFEMDAYGKVRWGTKDGFFEELPSLDRSQCVSWGYAAEAAEFSRLLDTGTSCLCTPEQGAAVAAAVEAARRSAGTWTEVKQGNARTGGRI